MGERKTTFGKLARRYAATVLATRDVKPTTRRYLASSLRSVQRVWVHLARTPVQEIAPADCQRWYDLRRDQVVAQRLNGELSMLKEALELARRDGLIAVNPAASLRGVRVEVKIARRIPTRDNFTKLIYILWLRGLNRAADYAELLAYSGLHPAEAAALTWGDIDFKAGTLSVRSGRTVPLFPHLRAHLLKLKKRASHPQPGDRILRNKQCKEALASTSALLRIPHMNHQRLRDFFIADALNAGVDYPVLADWLGHKDGGVTLLKMYGHVRRQDLAAMAARMTFRVNAQDASRIKVLEGVAKD